MLYGSMCLWYHKIVFLTANTETFGRAESSDSSVQNTAENSGTSENSDNTVIFMHQRQGSENSKLNTVPLATSPGKLFRSNVKILLLLLLFNMFTYKIIFIDYILFRWNCNS